jgi:Hemingway/CFA97
MHLQRLGEIRPSIKNWNNMMPQHLVTKSKAKLTKDEELFKITYENRLLIDKMSHIEGRANKHIIERRVCMESPSAATLHFSVNVKNNSNIIKENGVHCKIATTTKTPESEAVHRYECQCKEV